MDPQNGRQPMTVMLQGKAFGGASQKAILQKKSIQDYYAAQAKMVRGINQLRVKNMVSNLATVN